jgi:lambda family phage minor tail protein L
MSSIDQQARLLEPGKLVELYTIDAGSLGMPLPLYLHPYIELGTNVLHFQGHAYQPFPIKSEGWDWNTQGTLPRPKITVSNIDSAITAYLRQYGDFIGATVTRRRTYYEYLDDQPGESTTAEYTPDVFVVARKTTETNTIVEFELSSYFDAEGVSLPRRQILAAFCPWVYRGAECGYTGPPVADLDDKPLTATTDRGAYNSALTYAAGDYTYLLANGVRTYFVSLINGNTGSLLDKTKWGRDACSKSLNACKLRFGADNPLPFGGFPGAAKIPNV